jgi:excisionase family DNA binding protein
MPDQILTIREVADLLKINDKTAYRLAAEGKIPGFKVGGSWRFRTEDIDNWIRAKLDESGAAALAERGRKPRS